MRITLAADFVDATDSVSKIQKQTHQDFPYMATEMAKVKKIEEVQELCYRSVMQLYKKTVFILSRVECNPRAIN